MFLQYQLLLSLLESDFRFNIEMSGTVKGRVNLIIEAINLNYKA